MADPDAWVEIHIKCKVEGGVGPSPFNGALTSTPVSGRGLNASGLLRMPTIEENEGETDIREEVERKEKDYEKKLRSLETELDALKQIKDQKQKTFDELTQKFTKSKAD